MQNNNKPYYSRNPTHADIEQLIELEKEWPEESRASKETLLFRIDKFQQGFFVAVENDEIIASIICHPYNYQPQNITNFSNWEKVVSECYADNYDLSNTNALYIVSGTSKTNRHGSEMFEFGITHVVALAKKLGKEFVVGGCVLPGYSRYVEKYGHISAVEYAFKQTQTRSVDPLLDKYRRLGFKVPDENHVIENYFAHAGSMNYSALVVHQLSR